MKKILIFFISFCLYTHLYAQHTISGKVLTSDKEPYIGATVSEKGTLNYTTTDINGKFQLTVNSDSIVISVEDDRNITRYIASNDFITIIIQEELMKNKNIANVVIYNSYISSEKENTLTIPLSTIQKVPLGSTTEVLNNIPGLHMQSGGYNTNKLSIRGIGSTSQFATSDIKTFYNNIPLHSSIGESAIEDFGFHMSDRIEIIKGTTGSNFEAGYGGAINIINKNTKTEYKTEASSVISIGQWGNKTSQNQITIGRPNQLNAHNFSLYHSYVTDNGYRQNNEFKRNNVTLNYTFVKGKKLKITSLINHVDLKAFIPSSLNLDDYVSEPSKAAFTWNSAQGNEDYTRTIAGVNLDYTIDDNKSMTHVVYGQSFNSSELRPFNTIDETSKTIGIKGHYKHIHPNQQSVYTLGYRLQSETYDFDLFETEVDTKGSMFDNGNERRSITEIYAQMESEINEKWTYKLGLNTQYANISADENKVYKNAYILPDATLAYRLNNDARLYLSAGRGVNYFNPQEALLPNGLYNTNLLPSSVINITLGSKGFLSKHIQYRGEIYHMWVSDLIVTQRDTTNQAINTNGGSANYSGLEASIGYSLKGPTEASNKNLNIDFFYNLMQNKYDQFTSDDLDFSGNKIPGAPQQSFSAIVSANLGGLFGNIRYAFVDSYYMRDDNSIESDPYQIVSAAVGYKFQFSRWTIIPRADFINILDEKYASMILVNATSFGNNAPRYYYPGRPSNQTISLSIKYLLKK